MPGYDDSRFAPPAPVMLAVIRHPDSGESLSNIPMLIDSGADATLLPRKAVEMLGIVGTGERYQLLAFDGTTSESEAIRADLILVARRFRGRFLMIDAEIGVIGRDVLNHLRILLDGPKLNWELVPTSKDS